MFNTFHGSLSSHTPILCVLQCLWVRGPKVRGDGEDAEGGSAGENQADGEQSEFSFLDIRSL